MYKDTQIYTIDTCISKARKECRVFWIQCWDRTIFEKALNYSSALFGKIMDKSAERPMLRPGSYLNCLKAQKLIAEYDDFKKNDSLNGAVCLYLNDFQLSKQGEVLHHFLSHKQFAEKILVLVSTEMSVPIGFENDVLVIKVGSPTYEDIREMVSGKIKNNPKLTEKLSRSLKGYTETEIHTILHYLEVNGLFQTTAIANRKRDNFLKEYRADKLTKDGKFNYDQIETDEGSGMKGYTNWLEQHKVAFADPDFARLHGISELKGVLMTGLPGTGKTVMAKSTAYRLGIDYVELKLDELSTNKYGGSEELLRMYRDKVNSLGKAVVCIDEIEKSLGNDNNEGMHQVKKEQLQILLKWMQDSKGIFFFLTCNHVESLPPELKRDGRLSERFYTFMPTQEELSDMFHKFLIALNEAADKKLYREDLVNASKKLLNEVIDQLIKDACENGRQYSEDPFLTGANLRKLIEDTNTQLVVKKRQIPYDYVAYKDAMLACARNPDFAFFGETDFNVMAELWLYVRENKLRCVSADSMVSPFDRDFDDEKMEFLNVEVPKPPTYEDWFAYRFKVKMNERAAKALKQK